MKFAMLAFIALVLVGPAAARPIIRTYHEIRDSSAGLEILEMAFSLKMAETVLAVLSVSVVTMVYGFLIRRGSLMSTTAMYPRRSIEANIGQLLSLGWPDSSSDASATSLTPVGESKEVSSSNTPSNQASPHRSAPNSIQLFYLGKMKTDGHSDHHVAKGVLQCTASPTGSRQDSPLWLTSGSPLTKDVVQLLVWEWASLWLLILMVVTSLMYNGFFTDQLSLDSYQRLTVIVIYTASYLVHSLYVWNICSGFFTNVASGAAWSLLERAKFAVGDNRRLRRRTAGELFEFKSIDKASAEYVPTTFQAHFKHEAEMAGQEIVDSTSSNDEREEEEEEDPKDVRAALATLNVAQKSERTVATEAVGKALDRVVSNAMVMMSVTLSTGFSAWTSRQVTDDTPNNFNTAQIGSLALLASLSLGAAAMFTSALYLSIMDSSYQTIVSLKETKINGQAIDHYKKRRSQHVPLSFTSGTVPVSRVSFMDILLANRWRSIFGVTFLGPAYALLPKRRDYDRTSVGVDFDLAVRVREQKTLLTTRSTDQHSRSKDGTNVEAINVCHISEKVTA